MHTYYTQTNRQKGRSVERSLPKPTHPSPHAHRHQQTAHSNGEERRYIQVQLSEAGITKPNKNPFKQTPNLILRLSIRICGAGIIFLLLRPALLVRVRLLHLLRRFPLLRLATLSSMHDARDGVCVYVVSVIFICKTAHEEKVDSPSSGSLISSSISISAALLASSTMSVTSILVSNPT